MSRDKSGHRQSRIVNSAFSERDFQMKRDERSVLLAAICPFGMGLLGVARAEHEAANITPSLSKVDFVNRE
jgi:hypothetical protein